MKQDYPSAKHDHQPGRLSDRLKRRPILFKTKHLGAMVLALCCSLILSACGGSGTTSDQSRTPATAGVLVDPYIVGAVLQEIAADGSTVLQRQSTVTDDQGRFAFAQPLTIGSTVVMKVSRKGMHAEEPYQGLLRAKVTPANQDLVVVSPLTTLMASGLSAESAAALLRNAGIDLAAGQLSADPMVSLDPFATSANEEQLAPLRAALAVNAFMETVDGFGMDAADLQSNANFSVLKEMVEAFKNLTNAELIASVTTLSDDDGEEGPVIIRDRIFASVELSRILVERARENYTSN